jgi:membrane-bound metal-dependent hydrolase YbcI (DUF457 family)
MPQVVFHIVFAMLVAEFIREYIVKNKKKFPIHYVFIAGIAGILPDLDIAAFYILYFFGFTISEVHRTFTHTLFIPLFFILLAFVSWMFNSRDHAREIGKRHMTFHNIFLMIALGWLTHLVLDAVIAGVVRPFYPFWDFAVGLNFLNYLPEALRGLFIPSLDAAIFILWLCWMEYRHKLSRVL